MNPSQIIVLATPVFLLLIALEFAWELRTRRGSFGLADAINSLSLGILSQISAVFTRLLRIGLYKAVAGSLSLVPVEAAQTFWTSWYGWVLALLFYDLCYYWHHRLVSCPGNT
jgi:sterol desaturase/sphingolipid hydroxylase (fatty acid hydroxylase superfamily)